MWIRTVFPGARERQTLEIMSKILRIAAVMSIAFWSASASAASFDCSKASTRVERGICVDEELSELDVHLATYFRKIISNRSRDDAAQLKKAQRQWLAEVRNQCPDTDCVKLAYLTRLAELRVSGVPDDDYDPEDDCRPPEMPLGGANCAGYVISKKRELVETELRLIYAKVVSALPDGYELAEERQLPARSTFIDFFKTWSEFRKNYCAIYGDLSGGAQVWKSAMTGQCEVDSAAAQIRLLNVLLKCIDGKEACMFPDQFGY